jgi:intraflagellar transport protein 80
MIKETPEMGRDSYVENFSGSNVIITKKNGSSLTVAISPYPKLLLEHCEANDWEKAIKLCRYIKD